MSEIIQIDSYRLTSTESFFFDNNVWMFIHFPMGNFGKEKQKKYSKLLQEIISRKNNIFINSLLISEFINTCLRVDFREWCDLPVNNNYKPNFKEDFVGSDAYKRSVDKILAIVAQIRKLTQPGNDDFNSLNLDHILAGMQSRDFNDNYYLALAEKKNWTIVSDDSDLLGHLSNKVRIVTARRLT